MYYVNNGDPLSLRQKYSKGRRRTSGLTKHKLLCYDFSNQFDSFINLLGSTIPSAVFFNHFASAEPSVNVCVAYGTLCIDPSVCVATTTLNCGCEFRFRQFRSVLAEPLAATGGT